MAKARTLVGLEVHATKIVAAVLDADSWRHSGCETATHPTTARRYARVQPPIGA